MSDTNDRTTYAVEVGLDNNLGAKLLVAPEAGQTPIALVEHTLAPGKLAAPLHRHTNEDEISYVLDGRMGVQEGETVSTVAAGEVTIKERDVWHTFWNPGPEPLRVLELITPGEFAWYFQEAAEILPADGDPDEEAVARLAELHDRYDFEIKPGSVPELIERHGLDG